MHRTVVMTIRLPDDDYGLALSYVSAVMRRFRQYGAIVRKRTVPPDVTCDGQGRAYSYAVGEFPCPGCAACYDGIQEAPPCPE